MKKQITLSIIAMFLMSMLVLASPPVPAPIRGYFTINGVSVAGIVIEVTNQRTGEIITGDNYIQLVTQTGGFAFDLSYFKQGYIAVSEVYAGDPIQVQARGFGETGEVTFNAPEETPYSVTVAVISASQTFYQCQDGSTVINLASCPVIPEEDDEDETPTTTTTTTLPPSFIPATTTTTLPPQEPIIIEKIKCSDGTEILEGEDCPVEPEKSNLQIILITLIATIIGLFAWGKGFAGLIKYYLNKGNEAEKSGDKVLAKKYRDRAEKMAKTAVTNYLAGKYKK